MQIKQEVKYSRLESIVDILASCIYLEVVRIYGVIKAKEIEISHLEN